MGEYTRKGKVVLSVIGFWLIFAFPCLSSVVFIYATFSKMNIYSFYIQRKSRSKIVRYFFYMYITSTHNINIFLKTTIHAPSVFLRFLLQFYLLMFSLMNFLISAALLLTFSPLSLEVSASNKKQDLETVKSLSAWFVTSKQIAVGFGGGLSMIFPFVYESESHSVVSNSL